MITPEQCEAHRARQSDQYEKIYFTMDEKIDKIFSKLSAMDTRLVQQEERHKSRDERQAAVIELLKWIIGILLSAILGSAIYFFNQQQTLKETILVLSQNQQQASNEITEIKTTLKGFESVSNK